MDKPKIAIIGGGNAGFGLAGDLSLKGFSVNLYEFPAFEDTILPIKESDGIYVKDEQGKLKGKGIPEIITTDIKEATHNVDVIFISIPAWGHKKAAELCAKANLTSNQIIALLPGNFGGALEFRRIFLKNGGESNIIVAEASSSIFACRKISINNKGKNGVRIRGAKKNFIVGVLPSIKTKETLKLLNKIYDNFTAAEDVLETSLTNVNHWMHPPVCFMNLARVQSMGGGFPYVGNGWGEGSTKGVCRLIDALDSDRLKLIKYFGYKPITAHEWYKKMYSHLGNMKGDSIYEIISSTPVYKEATMANSIEERHFTEPVLYGLVPMVLLGDQINIELPIAKGLVNLFSATYDRDFWSEGRNMTSVGLDGLSAKMIKKFLKICD